MKLRIPLQIQYWLTIFVTGVLWLVGFTFGSGWGLAHDVYGKAELITIAVFVIFLFKQGQLRHVPREFVLLLLYLAFCFAYYKSCFDSSLFSYFWLFLLLPLMEELNLERDQMTIISLLFLLGSLVILCTATYTSILRGWDGNGISIPAFFSYTVFAVSFGEVRNWKKILFFSLITVFYFSMLYALNSRSSILFSLVLILCVFNVIPMRRWIRKRALILVLLAPLALAVLVVWLRNATWLESANQWSLEHFHKPLYSGRETIWYNGFQTWLQHPLLGNGSFAVRWHNNALTLLVGTGVVGYCLYISFIYYLLRRAGKYSQDSIINGLIMAYLMIWLQQSLEIGLISTKGNAIPFVILGLMLARAKTLERNDEQQTIGHYPDL